MPIPRASKTGPDSHNRPHKALAPPWQNFPGLGLGKASLNGFVLFTPPSILFPNPVGGPLLFFSFGNELKAQRFSVV